MSALEIVGTVDSSNVRVVRMVCEEKGIPYDYSEEAPPGSPVADAGHPFGAVPIMRHGDVILFVICGAAATICSPGRRT